MIPAANMCQVIRVMPPMTMMMIIIIMEDYWQIDSRNAPSLRVRALGAASVLRFRVRALGLRAGPTIMNALRPPGLHVPGMVWGTFL